MNLKHFVCMVSWWGESLVDTLGEGTLPVNLKHVLCMASGEAIVCGQMGD